jgi:hypothetical protein
MRPGTRGELIEDWTLLVLGVALTGFMLWVYGRGIWQLVQATFEL